MERHLLQISKYQLWSCPPAAALDTHYRILARGSGSTKSWWQEMLEARPSENFSTEWNSSSKLLTHLSNMSLSFGQAWSVGVTPLSPTFSAYVTRFAADHDVDALVRHVLTRNVIPQHKNCLEASCNPTTIYQCSRQQKFMFEVLFKVF